MPSLAFFNQANTKTKFGCMVCRDQASRSGTENNEVIVFFFNSIVLLQVCFTLYCIILVNKVGIPADKS